MDWETYLYPENEKPLDRLVDGYSRTSIFRTIGFIGDSLSSGEFETLDPEGVKRYHDRYEYSWGQFIARKNGLKAYNFSRGGMSANWFMESYADENGYWDEEKACQAYVIAMGVNDIYNQHQEIGTVADIEADRKDRPTFVGFYGDIVKRYKAISPDAKFFFVTFPRTERADSEETQGMIRALYDMADYFDNAYVIDLFQYGPTYDEKFKEHFYLYTHLNPSGYLLTAQLVDSYIDYIIRHNPDDFKNVGLINSGKKYWDDNGVHGVKE